MKKSCSKIGLLTHIRSKHEFVWRSSYMNRVSSASYKQAGSSSYCQMLAKRQERKGRQRNRMGKREREEKERKKKT